MVNDNDELGFWFRKLHNLTRNIIHNHCPKTEFAPESQLQAGFLGFLYKNQDKPIYQKNLEEEFGISRATATNTLQLMEKRGLLTRVSKDKDMRLKRLELTEGAMKSHAVVEQEIQIMEKEMKKGLSETELQELFRMLKIVEHNLQVITERESSSLK